MTKKRKAPIYRTVEQWQTLINEYRQSGLTQAAFCAQYQITPSLFSKWKKRLSPSVNLPDVGTCSEDIVEIPSALFNGPPSVWDLELSLGHGITLRLRQS